MMVGLVRQNRLHLSDWQAEIGRDVGFIDAGFPIHSVSSAGRQPVDGGPAVFFESAPPGLEEIWIAPDKRLDRRTVVMD